MNRNIVGDPPKGYGWPRLLYWSVQRELWENRSVIAAPVGVAVVIIVALTVGAWRLHGATVGAGLKHTELSELFSAMEDVIGALVTLAALVIGIFYASGALYNERRDRTILFWKSLPVSNIVTVVAKAAVPLVVLPLIAAIATLAAQIVFIGLAELYLIAKGLSLGLLWQHDSEWAHLRRLAINIVVLSLWSAPIYAWLVLISGWARRAPFLWAFGLPVGAMIFERLAFGSNHVGQIFMRHLLGGLERISVKACVQGENCSESALKIPFDQTQLWAGVAVAVILISVAILQRRRAAWL